MKGHRRHVDREAAIGSATLDTYSQDRSRPSKNNCTPGDSGSETGDPDSFEHWWQRKNEIVDRFIEQMPDRAARPVSVRGGTKLREECTIEESEEDDMYRARTWSDVLNEFLKWYNGYRDSYLVFEDPNGEEVRGDLPNSHQPRYGDKYYARLRAFERQIVEEYDDPHSVMLTFSGSSRNADGGWRCPCDHLRDVIESWRPDRGRGVYHTLVEVLEGKPWEYALVVEKHRSGYGHVHCAVFVDGTVQESDFHPVIDAHLRSCAIAHRDAHDYYSHNEEDRPISIKRIDPNAYEVDSIGNLGSYIGAYIGAYGEPLFYRGIDELAFRASIWATGTQVVRFSNGANILIREEREQTDSGKFPVDDQESSEYDSGALTDPHKSDCQSEIGNSGWSIHGIARIRNERERIYDLNSTGIEWREIIDSSGLDPPNIQPPDRPQRRMKNSKLP